MTEISGIASILKLYSKLNMTEPYYQVFPNLIGFFNFITTNSKGTFLKFSGIYLVCMDN